MNSILAASLFESPWIIVVIVLVSALSNWLAKRRQKQAEDQAESAPPPPSSDKPTAQFDLEATLRKLLGEEAPMSPPPPSLPRESQAGQSPVPDWQEEEQQESPWMQETAEAETNQPASSSVPPSRPPPIPRTQPAATIIPEPGEQQRQAARRFEQLNEQGRHPATVVSRGRGYPLRPRNRTASPWRDPRSARRAFVASLVFAPPKGLEY